MKITVLRQDGTEYPDKEATLHENSFFMDDFDGDVETGDMIQRLSPTGELILYEITGSSLFTAEEPDSSEQWPTRELRVREMARRQQRAEEPPRPARLLISKAQADSQIQEQIQIGTEIRNRSIRTEEEYRRAENDKETWYDFTFELLRHIFDRSEHADDFAGYGEILVGRLGYTPSWGENVQELHKELDKYLQRLNSIHARLRLVQEASSFPTPPPPAPHTVHVNVSGNNARANLYSQDYSTNTANTHTQTTVFSELRQGIQNNIHEPNEKSELLKRVEELESAKDKPDYLEKLAAFTTAAQNATTVIAPFLPALIEWGGKLIG